MGWQKHSYHVQATGDVTRLRFASLTQSLCGPALDAVSATPTRAVTNTEPVSTICDTGLNECNGNEIEPGRTLDEFGSIGEPGQIRVVPGTTMLEHQFMDMRILSRVGRGTRNVMT